MDVKSRGISFTTHLLFLLLSTIFSTSFSAPYSSVTFPIQGNIYPLGYYTVNFAIGNPPKVYQLDIDTSSHLTWVECDGPCQHCNTSQDQQYKPHRGNLVKFADLLCVQIQSAAPSHSGVDPIEHCDYEVEYADRGSSKGVLVKDNIPLKFSTGSLANPVLAIGCGYDQSPKLDHTAGVLGLGSGKISIPSQLNSLGVIPNVVGHCFGNEGGFLFFGDEFIPQSRVVWTPMLQSSSTSLVQRYKTGPADLFFNGKPIAKGLTLTFNSGIPYTYFNSITHKALVDLVTNDIKRTPLTRTTEDQSLPICWKGPKTFKSINDVTNYFKPLALSFTKSIKNSLLQLPPQAYLIVTTHGSVCLGILDGTEEGFGNTNIIGAISLQHKMVIFDNENKRIGWVYANCDRE